MKERNWKALAEELEEMLEYQTDATAVKVEVYHDRELELLPIKNNEGKSFHHMKTVVDFCRCKSLSCYVMVDYFHQNKVICRII